MASSSDAVEAITLTGKEVSASIDAYLFDALYSVDGIFTKGNQMEASIVSNNKVRIADGLLINQGHFLRIKPGMYCDVPIENGTQNMKRCDCIVAQFKIDEKLRVQESERTKERSAEVLHMIKRAEDLLDRYF